MQDPTHKHPRLGKYDLLELVDETATGEVYRARNTETNQDVLLKVLSPSLGRTASKERRHFELSPRDMDPSLRRVYRPYARVDESRHIHPATVLSIVLGLILVGLGGYLLGDFSRTRDPARGPSDLRAERRDGEDSPLRSIGPGPVEPGRSTAGLDDSERGAREALQAAVDESSHRRAQRDYEAAALALQTMAEQHPGTAAARSAQQELGRVYREWGYALEHDEDYKGARDKYEQALALLPAGDSYATMVRDKMPVITAKQAEQARTAKDYTRAVALYDEAARLESTDDGKARRLIEKATVLWQDLQDHERALQEVDAVLRRFPDQKAAASARARLPEIYADAARHSFENAEFQQTRDYIARLRDTAAGSEQAQAMVDLDAEALLRLFTDAPDGERAQREEHYAELFKTYPGTKQTRLALRHKLGARGTAPAYNPDVAKTMMEVKRRQFAQNEYAKAIKGLEVIIISTSLDSPIGAEAIKLLPAWRYEAALYTHGTGHRTESLRYLHGLASLFPHTTWAQEAEAIGRAVTNPPEGMAYVPEGKFIMGTSMDQIAAMLRAGGHELGPDNEQLAVLAELGGLLPETPAHEAVTGAFFIDVHEVTNEQYGRFVKETGHKPPAHWKGGSYPEGLDKFPVVNVSLADALAYAKGRGARLPTEAEWEKAARGVDGRPFPWGEAAGEGHHASDTARGPNPVGSYGRGASPYGCLDMIGNVSEWTTSDFLPYPDSTFTLRQEMAMKKVVRGLPLYPVAHAMVKVLSRCAGRYVADPAKPKDDVGFRCVVPAPQPAGPEQADDN